MNKAFLLPVYLLSLCFSLSSMAQRWPSNGDDQLAFHRGCVVIGLTEGFTMADYGVKPLSVDVFTHHYTSAPHDPLFIEYGLGKAWSAGIELSADFFSIDPAKYYGYATTMGDMQVLMSDVSLFISHHYAVTRRLDLSTFVGGGISAVTINGKDGDNRYQYNSGGYIVRGGTRGTYYVWKGFGLTGIVSAFTNYNSSGNFKDNTFGKNYMTQIKGFSWELGICYRFN